jgi:hypothetical protein
MSFESFAEFFRAWTIVIKIGYWLLLRGVNLQSVTRTAVIS